jgi:hypothetical protein
VSKELTVSFDSERVLFERELDSHYGQYPSDLSALERELPDPAVAHPDWPPCRRKAAAYDLLARRLGADQLARRAVRGQSLRLPELRHARDEDGGNS